MSGLVIVGGTGQNRLVKESCDPQEVNNISKTRKILDYACGRLNG